MVSGMFAFAIGFRSWPVTFFLFITYCKWLRLVEMLGMYLRSSRVFNGLRVGGG